MQSEELQPVLSANVGETDTLWCCPLPSSLPRSSWCHFKELSPNKPNQWLFLGGAARVRFLENQDCLGTILGKPHHSSLGFQTADSRTPRATPEPYDLSRHHPRAWPRSDLGTERYLGWRPESNLPALDTPTRPRPRPHFRPDRDHVP